MHKRCDELIGLRKKDFLMRYREFIGDAERKEEKKPSFLWCRLFVCVLVAIVFMNLPTKLKAKILTEISYDYTENVFDFIKEIPYNLGYEKTSIK